MTGRREKRFRSVLRGRRADLTVVLEDVHDPHNVGAMLRSADAVGVAAVQMVYVHEELPKPGKKSSASASKWVARRNFKSVEECFARLREEGFRIYATRLGGRSASLYDLDLTGKVALVFGNEHRGVSAEAARLADGNFQIPMAGMIRSLNVSVACAVSLYEAFRQRSARGEYRKASLSLAARKKIFDEWSRK